MIGKILKYLICLALASVLAGPLVALPLGVPSVNVYLTDIFVGGICLLWLVNFRDFLSIGKKDKVFSAFLVFSIIAFLSNIFSPISLSISERIISLLYLIRFVAYFTVYVTVLYLLKSKIIIPKDLGKWLGLVGLGLAIVGWMQYFLYPDLRNLYYLGWDPHFKRIFGSFLDPNYLGLIMVLTLLAAFSSQNPQRKCQHDAILSWMVKCFLFVTLLFTYSRSSYLALLSATIYYAWVKKKVWIIGTLLLVLVVSAFLLPRPGGEGVKLERVFSIEQRLENWKQGYKMFLGNPVLGIGFNTIRFAKKQYDFPQADWLTNHSGAGFENSFLFVLVTTGVTGLIFYILLLRQVFRYGSLAAKISLIAIIAHSFFLNTLFFPWVMIWMWTLLGINSKREIRKTQT